MMRETLQWILQRIILLIKKVSGWQGILVSGLLIKAVRNNDITKWGHFDKIKTLSEKINDPSPQKKILLDLTMTVSLDSKPKVSSEEKLRLVNQLETKIYKCFNTKNMKKDQIMFEDYEGLFLSKKIKLSRNNFELSIYLPA